jgi:hypothetical protein
MACASAAKDDRAFLGKRHERQPTKVKGERFPKVISGVVAAMT